MWWSLLACTGPRGAPGAPFHQVLGPDVTWTGETVVEGLVEVPPDGVLTVRGAVRFEPGATLLVRGELRAERASFSADPPVDLGQALVLAGDAALGGARFVSLEVRVDGDGDLALDGAAWADGGLVVQHRAAPLALVDLAFTGDAGGPAPALSVADAADVSIEGLTVAGFARGLEGFSPPAGAALRLTGATFTGGRAPVVLAGPFRLDLADVAVSGAGAGLALGEASGALRGVTVEDVDGTGISGVAPGELTLSDVRVSRAAALGLALGDGATGTDLTVEAAGATAVQVGHRATFARLEVHGAGDHCLTARDDLSLASSTLDGCGEYGLVAGDRAQVDGLVTASTWGVSTQFDADLRGLVSDLGGAVGTLVAIRSGAVRSSELRHAQGYGVSVTGDGTLVDVTVEDVGGIGAYVGGRTVATGLTLRRTGSHGLLTNSAELATVVVEDAGNAGVYAYEDLTLACGTIARTGTQGVVAGGPASVRDLEVSDAGADGVYAQGGGVVRATRVARAGGYGIRALGDALLAVERVAVEDVGQVGVLGNGAATTLTDANVTGSASYGAQSVGVISGTHLLGNAGVTTPQIAVGVADGVLDTSTGQVRTVDAVVAPALVARVDAGPTTPCAP